MGKVAKELSVHQKIAIVERWQKGEACTVLADEYGCSVQVIRRIVQKSGMRRYGTEPEAGGGAAKRAAGEETEYRKFQKEATEILRALPHDGRERDAYRTWCDYIKSLRDEKFSATTATIQASKCFAVLRPLFLKYDVEEHDPLPESHDGITHKKDLKSGGSKAAAVRSEDRELSYRENLRWAATAFGHHLRTKDHPTTTPNDFAWFLYTMAIEEPKDFMAKVASLEGRADDDSGDEQAMRREVTRSVAQIDSMLEGLCGD
jgi:hypothetical protein